MTDHELLEAAAKAAGMALEWDARGAYERIEGVSGSGTVWNPLTDDGDALRLAVKLRLDVCISVCRVGGEDGWYNSEADKFGIEAATRRAIVRAAAAIGAAK